MDPVVKAWWVSPSQFTVHSLSLGRVRGTQQGKRYLQPQPAAASIPEFIHLLNIYWAPHCVRGSAGHLRQIRGGRTDLRDPDIRPLWAWPGEDGSLPHRSPKGAPEMEPMCSPTRLLLWLRTYGHTSLSCGKMRWWTRMRPGGCRREQGISRPGWSWGVSRVLGVKALFQSLQLKVCCFCCQGWPAAPSQGRHKFWVQLQCPNPSSRND